MARWYKTNGLDNCFSKFSRILLLALNMVILIAGILVTTFATLLKYNKDFSRLIDTKALTDVINIAQINSIATLFISIGIFSILLSLLGIMGLCCLSRCFLIFYEIIIILLFVVHTIGFLVLLFGRGKIETAFKNEMVSIVERLNKSKNDTHYNIDCDTMLLMSNLFKCCGNNASSDFNENPSIINTCCRVSNTSVTSGCTQKAIYEIENNSVKYLLTPSKVILGVELVVIILNPLIIVGIRRDRAYNPFRS